MSYCLNPNCSKPQNPESTKFCQTCGTQLLLGNRYRAIKLIGQGGFGRTFLAQDEYKPSKPRCVIKQFYPEGQNNAPKAAELFEQEAVRLEQVGKHSQIPELYAYFEQENRQYIVQEFIDGQNLAQELEENGAFSEIQIKELLNDLLPVLQFIHQGEVIHRDIKPENIIRRRSDHKLVLVDFGAAKYATTTALIKTGTRIGSAEYAAPEQGRGKAIFASDIYSLGVTCLHLLTQMSPFDLFDIHEDDWVWRQGLVNNPVSDELGRILDKMVQDSLKERWQKVDEIIEVLKSSVGVSNPNTVNFQELIQTVIQKVNSPSNIPYQPWVQAFIQAVKSPSSISYEKFSLVATLSSTKDSILSVAISPDGQKIASGSEYNSWFGKDNTLCIWNIDSKQEIYGFSGHSNHVYSVAFSPDGKTLASGSADKTIKLWELSKGKEIRTINGHSSSIHSVAFSPDSKILASGSWDGTIKLWQVNTGKEICTLREHSFLVNSVAFSPDSKILASGSGDKTIKLWQVSTGKAIHTFSEHSGTVRSVAFSPDSKILASGSWDKTIKLWEVNTGKAIRTLVEHSSEVRSVAFSPDGRILVSGSSDKTIKIWKCD